MLFHHSWQPDLQTAGSQIAVLGAQRLGANAPPKYRHFIPKEGYFIMVFFLL
jgi:hypothetical protein